MNSTFSKYLTSTVSSNIKFPKFGDIITEQESRNDLQINVVILSSRNNDEDENDENFKWTVNRIKSYCEEHEIPKYVAYMGSAYITKDRDIRIHNIDDDNGFILNPDTTIVINRGETQISRSNTVKDFISQLERFNIFCLNNLKTIENCSDRYRTYLKLIDAGLLCPSSAIINSENVIDLALKNIGGKFPIVLKYLFKNKGSEFFIVESHKSLLSTLQIMWKLDPNSELLIQEYIDAEFSIKVHVLGNQIIAAIKNHINTNDIQSELFLGPEIEKTEINQEIKDACIKAAKAVGGTWLSINLLINKFNKKPYFLSINSSPSIFTIEKVLKQDLISVIMNYAIDAKNWIKEIRVCGYQESIIINEVGQTVAKFDTGNGATCALLVENVKINDAKKTVSWKYNGKEFVNRPYLRKIKLISGGSNEIPIYKATVNFDVTFNNAIYKNVEFALDDRQNKTIPALMNRKFMEDVKVIVDPSKIFLLSINPLNIKTSSDISDSEVDDERK